MKKNINKISIFVQWCDSAQLWLLGFLLMLIAFLPYIFMGEKSVFPWHDQLDEDILNYVLTARHFGENLTIIPEMMSGLNRSALQPYGILFLPLYVIFKPFVAFVIQYAIVFAIAFFSLYFLTKEITKSSIISVIAASCFSMLPFMPVYGAAVAGTPLAILAVLLLERKKKIPLAYVLLLIYASTAHLVFSGYAILTFWMF